MGSQFKNLKAEDVNAAYREVLGRDANAAELQGFTQNNIWFSDAKALKQGIAKTEEARRAGVDGSKYGTEYIDSADGLDAKHADMFNVLREVKGKKYRITRDELDAWANHGKASILRADQSAKTITLQNGTMKAYDAASLKFLTNEAGEVDDANFEMGQTFLVPKGTKLKGRLAVAADGSKMGKEYAGYDIVYKKARSRHGIVGSTAKAAGLGEHMANKLDRASGQALTVAGVLATPLIGPIGLLLTDEAAAIAGGTEGAKGRQRLVRKAGVSNKMLSQFDKYGDIGTAVVAGVVDAVAFGGAPIASTSNQLANQLEAESTAQSDSKMWRKTLTNVAVDWATYGATKGLNSAAQASKASAVKSGSYGTARAIGAANTTWTYSRPYVAARLKGQSNEDALSSAAQSAIVGFIPGAGKSGLAFRAATAGGLSYLDSVGRKHLSSKDAAVYATAASAGTAMSAWSQPNPPTAWQRLRADLGLSHTDGSGRQVGSLEQQHAAYKIENSPFMTPKTDFDALRAKQLQGGGLNSIQRLDYRRPPGPEAQSYMAPKADFDAVLAGYSQNGFNNMRRINY